MADAPEHASLASGDVTGSEEALIAPATPRSSSNSHALKVAGLTTLACLLVTSQVFAMFMLFDQKNQISMIKKNSEQLGRQLNSPVSVAATKKMELPMNGQLLLADFASHKRVKTQPTSKPSMTTKAPMTIPKDTIFNLEKHLKDLNSQLPLLEKSNLAPLLSLKSQMEKEWQTLESWMRSWLIKQEDQQRTQPHTTPASWIKTKCQIEAERETSMYGSHKPQCDEQGNYLPTQCSSSTGYCWCVDQTGKIIEGTISRKHPSCETGDDETGGELNDGAYYDQPGDNEPGDELNTGGSDD